MNEINKEELLNAIDDYDVYALSKRTLLKALINLAIDLEVNITPTALGRLVNLKRGIVYYNLKILEGDGFIVIKQPTQFILQPIKLKQLIKRYMNKLSFT